MLSPLAIVSLDQGKLYGGKPSLDEIEAGTIEDFGFAPSAVELGAAARADRHSALTARIREWLGGRVYKLRPRLRA